MSKRITSISNLLELIENDTITITRVQCKTKAFANITETDNVSTTDFVKSLQYLNKAKLFRDGIDFYYEFTDKNSIRIECGMKNLYMDEYFYSNCVIKDGISIEDIDKKFRETIFDKMDRKIAV